MILYLLKSVACLLILLLVHRLIFQREAIYRFNRFYLLAAVLGSFFIPLLEIEVAEEVTITPQVVSQEFATSQDFQVESYPDLTSESSSAEVFVEEPTDWNLIFWIVYEVVTLVFLIRFIRNINLLIDKINRNVHVRYRGETLVLLKEQQLPFSFLSYIFVAKDYLEKGQLTESIFAHEQAHVHGRHSWDNLLMEGLLVIFWFHPGLYLARQAIKLNHEFIADEAALQITPLVQYKSLLLAMMLPEKSPGLASSLNFSLTKKRFEMMKRKTANSTKWILILGVIPVFAGLVYVFSEKVTSQEGEESKDSLAVDMDTEIKEKEIQILLGADGKLEVDGQIVELSQLAELIESNNNENTIARIAADPEVEMGFLADVQEVLRENEIRKVVYQGQTKQKQVVTWQKDQEDYYQNAYILVEDADMKYTHKTYYQLTDKEKEGLFFPIKPKEKAHPDQDLFDSWMDNKTYALWIDGVVSSNEKLKDFEASDFVFFYQSSVKSNARSEQFPQPFQVHLYSDAYYDQLFGPNSPGRKPLDTSDTVTLTQRRVTWGKDISRYPDPNTAYLQKNARYENLRTSGTIYDQKSQEEKALLDSLYKELSNEYSQSSDKRKRSLKEPISPDSDIPRNGGSSQNSSEKIAARTVSNSGDEGVVYSLVPSTELKSDDLKEYLTLYGQYQTRAYENRLFAQPVNLEILEQQKLYRTLEAKYNGLSFEERRRVKRADFPYVKMEKDGKEVYVKIEDLTPQQRKELGC
ncbi:MAG TPA: M56 family metallopeptidase [Algoriphagus sp.]|nr:M56 family metallopeptidase [Algoriphagus sp.]